MDIKITYIVIKTFRTDQNTTYCAGISCALTNNYGFVKKIAVTPKYRRLQNLKCKKLISMFVNRRCRKDPA